jgi:hypothetical protein
MGRDWAGAGESPVTVLYEYGDESSGYIKAESLVIS